MKMTRGRALVVRAASAGVVLVLCVLPAVLGSGPALASTVDGTATITNQVLNPLGSGGSGTQFSVALPANAACSGDTATSGYHVYSYLVHQGTVISSLTFTSFPSQGLGLVNNVGVYYGSKNTAITTGQIVGIPTNFEFGPLINDGVSLSSLLYGGTSGVWEAGIACADSTGALSDYWNTEVTLTASGTDPDGFVWSAVPGGPTLPQVAPAGATTSPASSSTFTDQLAVADANGPVTYAVTTPVTGVAVSSSGAVSTTGTLAVGTYTVRGTDADTAHEAGAWTFSLVVAPATLSQAPPASATVGAAASSTFTDQLGVSGALGSVAFSVTAPTAGLSVSSTGALATTGALAAGTYTVHGTDVDSEGDTGTWSFALTVAPNPDTFTSAAGTSAIVGQSFTFPVTTNGTAKVKSQGKLPKGVTFNKASHVLSGTPTSTKHRSAAGTYHLTFTATFGKGKTKVVATQPFTLIVTS